MHGTTVEILTWAELRSEVAARSARFRPAITQRQIAEHLGMHLARLNAQLNADEFSVGPTQRFTQRVRRALDEIEAEREAAAEQAEWNGAH